MKIQIIRSKKQSSDKGTFGTMLVDGVLFAYTCERPVNDAEHPCVLAGTYVGEPYDSPAHGKTIVLVNHALNCYGPKDVNNHAVPHGGRTFIEIHNANWPYQLLGCVAVGKTLQTIPPGGLGVTESVKTYHALQEKWGDRSNITVEISWQE